jgi:hypothetical protein
MSLRTSVKNLIRLDASTPSLRERAANLRASVSARTAGHSHLPAPGSAETKAASAAACREHSIRTNPPGGWPDLAREGDQIWTRHDLGKAMGSGEITPAEYARLYPLASERELQIETVGHQLNLGALFALAYADEYPVRDAVSTDAESGDALSAHILTLWPAWAAHTGDNGTDEQTAAYEAMQQRRFALLDAADALPATPNSSQAKALALAWLHYVNEWRQGQKRDDYSTDGRLAIDIHMAALAQQGQTPLTVARHEPNLVGMLDLASASTEDLRAVHDVADLVESVAYATTWQVRRKAHGAGDHANVAGRLMHWLCDALTAVKTAASEEATRRVPNNSCDRKLRLAMRAVSVIDNDDPEGIEAFARELAAHAAAERARR